MIFIWEYGLTNKQSAWIKQASKAEVAAFMLSAPLRIACQGVLTKEGKAETRFLPTIHGVPVANLCKTPEEAMQEGLRQRGFYIKNHEGLQLDLDALGIRGADVDEYATPEGHAEAVYAKALRKLSTLAATPTTHPQEKHDPTS